jgi:hypothetical protein
MSALLALDVLLSTSCEWTSPLFVKNPCWYTQIKPNYIQKIREMKSTKTARVAVSRAI